MRWRRSRLKNEKIVVQLQDLDQQADFLLIGFEVSIDSNLLDYSVNKVEEQSRFNTTEVIAFALQIFGKELRLARFPQDMTYPFPTILLFRHD
jgi:hypothetical protein